MMQRVAWSMFQSKLGALDQLGEQRIDNFHLSLLGGRESSQWNVTPPRLLAVFFGRQPDLTDGE